MTSRADIDAFVGRLVDRFKPRRVILFGSHAYGIPTHDSDVDLLVVMRERSAGASVASQIRLACPRAFPMDLLVRSADEVRRGVSGGDPFLTEVTTKGIVLHEARHARVD